MALGCFDYIQFGTTLVRGKDGARFTVVDATYRIAMGYEVTVLVLVELNEAGYTAGKRKLHLMDTPANRAGWSLA